MSAAAGQQEKLAELARASRELSERVRVLAAGLGDRQLAWQPPGGGWSIGQVLEHLCVANDSYLERLRTLVPAGGAGAPVRAAWKPSLMGGLLARSMRSPRRLPAPKVYRPAPQPRPRVVDEFLRRQDELERLLGASAGVDWRRTRTTSPVSRLVRMNLGDCFVVLVEHGLRHLGQMERIRSSPGFPAGPA